MKQINVPVVDEVYEAAVTGASEAGMYLKAWVARAILNQAAKEWNDASH
jgi:predicted HicB family RNase H-like nuclease